MTALHPSTTPASPRAGERLAELDGLRGLAALAVFFCHALSAFFPLVMGGESGDAPLPLLRQLAMKYPLGWLFNGTYAVSIFFCLSGLVMTWSLFATGGAARTPEFVARRWLRLAPMVAAGTLLGYFVLEMHWVFLEDLRALNGVTAVDVYPARALADPSLVNAVRQIVWDVWVGGGPLYDIPLWTIGTEFKCSVVVVLLAALFLPVRARGVAWMLTTWIGMLVCGEIFVCFAVGGLLAEGHARDRVPAWLRSSAVLWAMLVAGLFIGSLHADFHAPAWWWIGERGLGPWSGYIRTFVYAAGGSALLLCALYLRPFTAVLRSRVVHFLGFISYGFYAVHEPLLHSLGTWFCTRQAGSMGYFAAAVTATGIVLLVCLPLAYVLVRWMDGPLNRVSARIAGRWMQRRVHNVEHRTSNTEHRRN